MKSLKGKKVGVWFEQTPDEYLKIALSKAGLKKGEVELVNIASNPALVPSLAEGKVDAVVSLEPWNTLILDKVPGSYVVKRGGGYMSYMMVSTFQDAVIKAQPELVEKFAIGPRGVGAGGAAEPRRGDRDLRQGRAGRRRRDRQEGGASTSTTTRASRRRACRRSTPPRTS